MTRYNWAGPGTGISDPANGIALRADVAHLWGVNAFLLVPAGQQGGFMTYVTMPRLGLAQEFHRRWVPISQRVSDAFLYARFAYTIITLVAKLGDKKLDAFPLPKGVKPSRRGGTQHAYVVFHGPLTFGVIARIYFQLCSSYAPATM